MENPLSLNSGTRTVLDLSSKICTNGERGVNSMLVDPDFNSNRYVYVFYTWNKNNFCGTDSDQAPVNRLSRFLLADDFIFGSETHLLQTDPVIKQYHNGGGIVWGKDGNIWLVTADGGEREHNYYTAAGQRKDNLRAKLLRIRPNGDIPSDNPFRGSNSVQCKDTGMTDEGKECQEIFAMGLRNPWSMSIDPYADKTRLLINDVGGSAWEEINLAGADYPRANYGFPVREGPCKLAQTTDCDNEDSIFTSPYYYYIHRPNPDPDLKDEGAGTAGDFLPPNSGWPSEYSRSYFYADFVFNEIYRLVVTDRSDCKSCNPPTSRFDAVPFTEAPRITRIHFGPDNNGKRLCITLRMANRVPVAKIKANPTYGALPLTVTFDATESSDPDGDILSYEWDLDGNGSTDSTSSTTSFTFETAGIFTAKLTVKDGKGATSSTTVRIDAGNTPPVPTISLPLESTVFSVGDILTLVGSATDAEEGDIPDTALEWYVDKHHGDHTHPYLAWSSGNNIAIDPAPIPEDFMAATVSFLRIHLKATDSTGLSAEVTRDIQPNKVTMQFTSNPSGMTLLIDGFEVTTPYNGVSWKKHELKVEAPHQGDLVFDSWSDRGSQVHTIRVEPGAWSFRAFFRKLELKTLLTSSNPGITSNDGPVTVDGLTGVTIEQLADGKLVIMNLIGGTIIWESSPSSDTESLYRTIIQNDGNLVTRRVSDNFVVWKSQNEGGQVDSSCGFAFLAIEAEAQMLGVYCGPEDNISKSLWTTETTSVFAPTSSPTAAPRTMEPTVSPTQFPTIMPTTSTLAPTLVRTTAEPTANTPLPTTSKVPIGTALPSAALATTEPTIDTFSTPVPTVVPVEPTMNHTPPTRLPTPIPTLSTPDGSTLAPSLTNPQLRTTVPTLDAFSTPIPTVVPVEPTINTTPPTRLPTPIPTLATPNGSTLAPSLTNPQLPTTAPTKAPVLLSFTPKGDDSGAPIRSFVLVVLLGIFAANF